MSKRFLSIFTVLMFLLAACGSGGEETAVPTLVPAIEEPVQDESEAVEEEVLEEVNTPVPEEEAPVEDVPVEAPSTDEEESVLSLNAENNYGEPSNVSSYKITAVYQSTYTDADGNTTTGTFTINGERDVENNALSFNAQGEGNADFGAGESFSFVQFEDATYFTLPTGECLTVGQGMDENPYSIFLEDGGFLGELNNSRLAIPPSETVNGVDTWHYVFNESNLNPLDENSINVSALSGDIWIAKDGGHVVRMLMEGTGVDDLITETAVESDISYELNYFDFNQPVNLSVPENCSTAEDVDYPIMDDATSVNNFGGTYTYETSASAGDVVTFYKEEMAALGWTLGQDFATEEGGFLAFSNDGEEIQVAIGVIDGGTSVAIIAGP